MQVFELYNGQVLSIRANMPLAKDLSVFCKVLSRARISLVLFVICLNGTMGTYRQFVRMSSRFESLLHMLPSLCAIQIRPPSQTHRRPFFQRPTQTSKEVRIRATLRVVSLCKSTSMISFRAVCMPFLKVYTRRRSQTDQSSTANRTSMIIFRAVCMPFFEGLHTSKAKVRSEQHCKSYIHPNQHP